MGELGEEFGLEFRGVGEVIGVRDVADGFEGFEERGLFRGRFARNEFRAPGGEKAAW